MKYLYKNNQFFPVVLHDLYVSAGWDLRDAVEVSDDIFLEFTGYAPSGKTRGTNADGYPVWIDATIITDPSTSPES